MENRSRDRLRSHLLDSADVLRRSADDCAEAIGAAVVLITETFCAGGKLLLCGNGGSAADCQHMAAEFVNRLCRETVRGPLPAIALTTDTSFLTAFSNDCGFEGVFERQVEALGRPGDALIAISTSGRSANALRAVEAARRIGMRVIALTGADGHLMNQADVVISVPSRDTPLIQESHLAIEHVICALVEARMAQADDAGRAEAPQAGAELS